MNTSEWRRAATEALAEARNRAGLSPADEAELVEEWAQHAESAFAAARAVGRSNEEATADVLAQIDGWGRGLSTPPRRRYAPAVPPPANSGGWRLWQDVRYAWRLLRKQPGFAALAILTTGLAVGAVTTLFSVADGVLARPLPFPDADQLIRVTESREGATRRLGPLTTQVTYQLWREAPETISGIGGFSTLAGVLKYPDGTSARVTGARFTASMFPVLGVAPVQGRVFDEAAEATGAQPVVVVSQAFWRDRLNSDPDAIGRIISLDDQSHEVVAIMPEGFAYPTPESSYWVPLHVLPATVSADGTQRVSLFGAIARMRPGVAAPVAAAEATARVQGGPPPGMIDTALYGSQGARVVTVVPLLEFMTAEVRPAILALLAAVGLLLLTAVANISSLQLAKATARRRELAIRAALGAGLGRLVRQLLVESALLGIAGGLAGLGLAVALTSLLPGLLPENFPRASEIAINGRALIFAGGVAIFAGLLFGVLPALDVRRIRLAETLTEDGQAPVGIGTRTMLGRLRMSIIVGQVAAAAILLAGALLLGRTFDALWTADRGYNPSNLLAARLPMPDRDFTPTERGQVLGEVTARARALPGVVAAGVATVVPLSNTEALMGFTLPPRGDRADPVDVQVSIRTVSDGFFEALGATVAAGRTFTSDDTVAAPSVIVVNETFMRTYLPGESLGARLPIAATEGREESEIVGILRDVQPATRGEAPRPEVYYAAAQVSDGFEFSEPTLLIRTDGDPMDLVPPLRQAVQDIDPRLYLDGSLTMESRLAAGLARPRLYAILFASVSVLALLIAGVGVFGVLSHNVVSRRREIGVRTALGATPGRIIRLTVAQGVTMAGLGLVLGLGAAAWVSRYLESLLWGVSAHDPISYVGVAVGLLAMTAVACWVPARRAARVDPLTAMRK
jgi:predicted permease